MNQHAPKKTKCETISKQPTKKRPRSMSANDAIPKRSQNGFLEICLYKKNQQGSWLPETTIYTDPFCHNNRNRKESTLSPIDVNQFDVKQ